HPGIPKPDAGQRGGQEHLALRLKVLRIADRAGQVLDGGAQRVEREDVADRVRALVGRAQDGVGGARDALAEGDGRPRLERVAQHVQAGAGAHGGGHGARVERVADAQRRLEVAVGDARLGAPRGQVEDGRARRLAARAGRRGHRDQRVQLAVDGPALAQRRVDEVEEVRVRVARVQVHELGRVDDRAAADGQEGVRPLRLDPLDRFLDAGEERHVENLRIILRLNLHVRIHHVLDPLAVQRLPHLPHRLQLVDRGVRHHAHALRAQVLEVHADLPRRPGPEADRGRGHLERVLLLLGRVARRRVAAPGTAAEEVGGGAVREARDNGRRGWRMVGGWWWWWFGLEWQGHDGG
ncbi:bd6c9939-491b-41ab-b150-aeb5933a5800, partial [Thermothielavioides terrestris]